MVYTHAKLVELNLDEINAVSGADRGDAAVQIAGDMGATGAAIGAAIGSVGGIVGAGIGAAIGGTLGYVAGGFVGAAIYDEFNMLCES